MSTPEPPRGEQPERPEGPADPNRPASEQPTVQHPVADGQPAAPDQSAAPEQAGPEQAGTEQQAESPAEAPRPATAAFDTPPAAAAGGRKWYRPRRTWPWITGGVVGGVVALLLVFGAGALVGSHHGGGWHQGRHHGGEHGRMYGMAPQGGGFGGHGGQRGQGGPGGFGGPEGQGAPGGFGGPEGQGAPGGPGGPGGMGPGGFGHGGFGGGFGDGPGQEMGAGARMGGGSAVVGSLVTINGSNLVLTQDGGAQVTLTTTPQTRVVGQQRATLADLKAGDRIAVREDNNHQALGVLVIPARAFGTVTALNGDQATLTRADGLTETVDLSGVTNKPQVGDQVVVSGNAANNGSVLKATELRDLPKAG